MLAATNFAIHFVLAVDASDLGAGAVLMQHGNNGLTPTPPDTPTLPLGKKPLVLALQHFVSPLDVL